MQLTRGDWPVDALLAVDQDQGLVYFSAGMRTTLLCLLGMLPYLCGISCQVTQDAVDLCDCQFHRDTEIR
jgi:hypothetical protein